MAKNGPGGGSIYTGGVHFQRVKMDRGVHFQRVKMDRGSIFNGGPFSISHRRQQSHCVPLVAMLPIVYTPITHVIIDISVCDTVISTVSLQGHWKLHIYNNYLTQVPTDNQTTSSGFFNKISVHLLQCGRKLIRYPIVGYRSVMRVEPYTRRCQTFLTTSVLTITQDCGYKV